MTRLLLVFIIILTSFVVNAQENLQIQGAISLGESKSEDPAPGTLRWQNDRLEVYNGIFWEVLSYSFDVGTVIDIDDNKYKTVMIGDTEWMIENLRTTQFADKSPINYLEDAGKWNTTEPAYCWPNGDSNNEQDYGALYNWYAVGTGKLCPLGWNVPSVAQWTDLFSELGGNSNIVFKLQSRQWRSEATNESGFSALPAGYRYWFDGIFYDYGGVAWFWTSTSSGSNATEMHFGYSLTEVEMFSIDKRHGYSVRCVR